MMSFTLAETLKSKSGVVVIVAPDSLTAIKLERDLNFFLVNHDLPYPILSFPDWETLPYDNFSPHQDIISARLTTLFRLPHLNQGILIVPISTLMQRLCPKSYLLQSTFLMQKVDRWPLTQLRRDLQHAGYYAVSEVRAHGEFAVRGSIVDVFPMGSKLPFRLDFFDDNLESIRSFDVETQRSLEKVESLQLLPAHEFPLSETGIATFKERFRDAFDCNPRESPLYLEVMEGHAALGLEYYLPLFFEQTEGLFDYFPKNTSMLFLEGVHDAALETWNYINARFDQYGHDRLRPILAPKEIFFPVPEVFEALKSFSNIDFEIKEEPLPNLELQARAALPLERLSAFLDGFGGRVLFTAESAGRKEVYKDMLAKIQCHPIEVRNFEEFMQLTSNYALCIAPLEQGFILESKPGPLALIPETALFGQRVMQARRRKTAPEWDFEVRSLAELNIGAPVVHIEHGVGRYRGLQILNISGQEAEYLTIEYAGNDKLYVPVSALHLVSRYSGVDLEHAPLHQLGSGHWQKIKHKVLEETRDVAAELLNIYAKRELKQRPSFLNDELQYQSFEHEFPFEETPDQAQAIHAVLKDLQSTKPMDRVVCGDVGFGKTEVAMRAAFVVASNSKQVAILVPTTLLAEQHLHTFSDRFAQFPLRVDVLSRFRSAKEQKEVIEDLKLGKIDIIIGTHKLLQKDIQFKNLGLLVIDEEHRFGVRQKDTFKALRAEVDILTLTATPIPRTLNMAMSGMRDLSIIASPPAKRLSVKTFVREKSNALIEEAISRELHRGGQVYYVYNTVETIERAARELEALLPSARIAIAHGQMRERDLEKVMSDFYHGRSNVLVCSTIIETGIDIPAANTIIIERADKFGLAQLHQLRGRVGRSHHQAYAFCLLPLKNHISLDAEKRLEALEALDDLGVGFSIATHDLEIRGAGELLGEEQSGNIQSVGFPLYMELLENAVKLLQAGESLDVDFYVKKQVEIDLKLPTLIPEAYLPDVHSRLVLYKRIAGAATQDNLDNLKIEMIDRFGQLPLQTQYLFKVTALKLRAEMCGIMKIEAGPKGGRIEFGKDPKIDTQKLIYYIQKEPNIYQFEGPTKLRFKQDLSDAEFRLQVVENLVVSLAYLEEGAS